MTEARPLYSSIALWVLAIIATAFFLRAARQLFIPITIAVLLSYALEPVVAWLARHRVARPAGASLLLLAIVGVSACGIYSLRDDVAAAAELLPRAAARVRDIVSSHEPNDIAANVKEAATQLQGAAQTVAGEQAPTGTAEQSAGTGEQQQAGAGNSILVGFLQQSVNAVLSLAGNLVVIVFLIFFLLLAGNHFHERIIEVAGPSPERQRRVATIVNDINAQVQRFLLVRLVTGVIVAIATWAVLAWMGVPQAAVWGILAGVFNSIPYFGPLIVSGGLLLIGLVQGGGLAEALKMSGAALVITSLEGWLLDPPLMGKAEQMNALVVFLGVLVWTWIWGAWGTILAVPMLVVVKSVADQVGPLKRVSRLMAP